jgi:hypothetical protein
MAKERPVVTDDDHRVLKFRPRTMNQPPRSSHGPRGLSPAQPPDLSRFEQSHDIDDYRHRMIMNVAAGIITVALTGFGIWLATSIVDLRRTQDCILSGRQNCAVIPTRPN